MNRRDAFTRVALGTVAVAIVRPSLAGDWPPNQKAQVVGLLKAIETGDSGAVAVINPKQYKQHNLAVADGLAGFGAALKQLPSGSARVKAVRVFQDGHFVFAHTDYNFFGPKIGFDVFRFENGAIVEHWDNLQETPAHPNPSQHTMIDGPTEATDLDKTAANKTLVRKFVEAVLVRREYDQVSTYIDAKRYIQHNPNVGDGVDAMVAAFRKLDASGSPHRYSKIHQLLGEGNFVLTTSEGTAGNTPTAFYDLFRIENGLIVEHWDTLETIPPKASWKNANGKF